MNFLLDTNVVSEWTKQRPNAGVVAWLAELRHGIERLQSGALRARLNAWLSKDLPVRLETRVLPVDVGTANT